MFLFACSGRLDSTNILNPYLCVITSIGLEHTQFLGNTIEEITREKAGIIKHKTPVVVGPNVPHHITKEIAEKLEAPHIILQGSFKNFEEENTHIAECAIQALINIPLFQQVIPIVFSPLKIISALQTRPPCRFEMVNYHGY